MIDALFLVVILPSYRCTGSEVKIAFDRCCPSVNVRAMRTRGSDGLEILELRQVRQFQNAHVVGHVELHRSIEVECTLCIIVVEDDDVVLYRDADQTLREIVEIARPGEGISLVHVHKVEKVRRREASEVSVRA